MGATMWFWIEWRAYHDLGHMLDFPENLLEEHHWIKLILGIWEEWGSWARWLFAGCKRTGCTTHQSPINTTHYTTLHGTHNPKRKRQAKKENTHDEDEGSQPVVYYNIIIKSMKNQFGGLSPDVEDAHLIFISFYLEAILFDILLSQKVLLSVSSSNWSIIVRQR